MVKALPSISGAVRLNTTCLGAKKPKHKTSNIVINSIKTLTENGPLKKKKKKLKKKSELKINH